MDAEIIRLKQKCNAQLEQMQALKKENEELKEQSQIECINGSHILFQLIPVFLKYHHENLLIKPKKTTKNFYGFSKIGLLSWRDFEEILGQISATERREKLIEILVECNLFCTNKSGQFDVKYYTRKYYILNLKLLELLEGLQND